MVAVPRGRTMLKDERTGRRWYVDLDAFQLGRHAVTQREYRAVTGAPPSGAGDDALPVVDVSWIDAIGFCNLLSAAAGFARCYTIDGEAVELNAAADDFRLPTEAEWEHACRAGSDDIRYGELDEIAWYRDNSDDRLHACRAACRRRSHPTFQIDDVGFRLAQST